MAKYIEIKIPYELAAKLSSKMEQAGFEKLTPYIQFILEQVIDDGSEDDYSKEDEKEVRQRLKDLGYL